MGVPGLGFTSNYVYTLAIRHDVLFTIISDKKMMYRDWLKKNGNKIFDIRKSLKSNSYSNIMRKSFTSEIRFHRFPNVNQKYCFHSNPYIPNRMNFTCCIMIMPLTLSRMKKRLLFGIYYQHIISKYNNLSCMYYK